MNHLFTLGCYISSICTESSSPSPTISKSSNSESDDRSEGSDRSVRDPHESFGVRSYGVNSLNFLAGEISFEILDCDDEDKFVVLLSSEDKVVSPKSGRLKNIVNNGQYEHTVIIKIKINWLIYLPIFCSSCSISLSSIFKPISNLCRCQIGFFGKFALFCRIWVWILKI